MPLNIQSQPRSVQSLYGQFRSDEILVNRAYQRKLVWTLPEKKKLIDSLLNQFPVPLILLAESKTEPNVMYILDGMQRLDAIFGFIENRFSLEDGKYFDIDEFARAKDCHEKKLFEIPDLKDCEKLSRDSCAAILDYSLPVSVVKNADDSDIVEVFGRINSYGRQLSEQEQRQAGLRSNFAEAVREIACEIRGDSSPHELPLSKMPSISIEPVSQKVGNGISAEEVFWVEQRILRSTDLRDSLDEQVIADTIACSLFAEPIERSKEALNNAYEPASDLFDKIEKALAEKSAENVASEYKYIVSEIQKIVTASGEQHLRGLIFSSNQTNAFPSVYAAIHLALYEIVFKKQKAANNYADVAKGLRGIAEKITAGQAGRRPEERIRNINTVVGNIEPAFTAKLDVNSIYQSPVSVDVANILMASQTENAILEIKQGLLRLDEKMEFDVGLLDRIPEIICALSNVVEYPHSYFIFGVTDSKATAERVKQLFGNEADEFGSFFITGVEHEAAAAKISIEAYCNKIRDKISNSALDNPIKSQVLSSLFCLPLKSKTVICMKVKAALDLQFLGDTCFVRDHNEVRVADGKQISKVAAAKVALQKQ